MSGRRQDPGAGGGNRVGRFFRGVDVHGKFVFANSAGTDPTFGLATRFRRPFLFSAFGDRNQLSLGPEAELRANSSDQDDEDSIVLSVPITYTRTRGELVVPVSGPAESPEAPFVNAWVFDMGPAVEVDKSFGSGNLVADGELSLGLAVQGGGTMFWMCGRMAASKRESAWWAATAARVWGAVSACARPNRYVG